MDSEKVRAVVDHLRRHNLHVKDSFNIDDPDEFLDALLAALEADLEKDIEEGPVVMSIAGHSLTMSKRKKSTSEMVDDFFSMLPGGGKGQGA